MGLFTINEQIFTNDEDAQSFMVQKRKEDNHVVQKYIVVRYAKRSMWEKIN